MILLIQKTRLCLGTRITGHALEFSSALLMDLM